MCGVSCVLHTCLYGLHTRDAANLNCDATDAERAHARGVDRMLAQTHWVLYKRAFMHSSTLLSQTHRRLHSFSINGRPLTSADTGERLYAFLLSEDGRFLVTGGDRKTICIRTVHE